MANVLILDHKYQIGECVIQQLVTIKKTVVFGTVHCPIKESVKGSMDVYGIPKGIPMGFL